MSSSTSKPLIAVMALIVGLNLRPIMAAVGPLLTQLQQDLHLTSAEASLLTTLPVLMMGIFSLYGPQLQRWLGEVKGITLSLGLIIIANASRLLATSGSMMIISAVLGGIGIAMIQALMPSFLKRSHPESANTLMGLFTTGIMGGAALAATTAAPATEQWGWHVTFMLAAIPACVAGLIWYKFAKEHQTASTIQPLPVKEPRAWLLMLFFGLGTGAYTLVLSWLAPYYMELDWSAEAAGYALGGITLAEVSAGLIVSSVIGRFNDKRGPLAFVLLILILGLICLICAPIQLVLPALIMIGLGIGALFPLGLIVTLDHAHSPQQAASLMAFVQGGGYLLASTIPYGAGLLRDHLSSLHWAWVGMIIMMVLLLVVSRRFRPPAQVNS